MAKLTISVIVLMIAAISGISDTGAVIHPEVVSSADARVIIKNVSSDFNYDNGQVNVTLELHNRYAHDASNVYWNEAHNFPLDCLTIRIYDTAGLYGRKGELLTEEKLITDQQYLAVGDYVMIGGYDVGSGTTLEIFDAYIQKKVASFNP